jgi:hypothetical protein
MLAGPCARLLAAVGLVSALILLCASPAAGGRVAGAAPAYLPNERCLPFDIPTDDAANAYQPPGAHVIKVIYAHASDSPNSVHLRYPDLAEGVRDMVEYVYLESGDRKSIRFDLGTAAGPDCLDVQRVSLPNPASYYDRNNVTAAGQKVEADVRARLGPQPGFRNYIVFADGVPNDFRSAIADGQPGADSPDGAAFQGGNRFAVIFDNDFTFGLATAFARVGAHELWHLLGAVQPSAPHHGGGSHCTERNDLMCDPAFGGSQLCPSRDYTTTVEDRPLDCGRDDYFNPAPAPGSYLATHWNTYNSFFLCPIGTCVPDNIDPETEIRGPRETTDRTPTFRLRSDEKGVEFNCKLDRRRLRPCEKRYVAPRLAPGRHKLKAEAVDAAGNDDRIPALHIFRIVERRGGR